MKKGKKVKIVTEQEEREPWMVLNKFYWCYTKNKEDDKNKNGGCFSFKIINKKIVNVWKKLSYVLTGETVSNDPKFQKSINGITISPKKSFCIM